MSECDYRSHYHSIFSKPLDPIDEARVDLDRVDRQVPEITERRVSRSEIVDHDAHSALAQRSELLTSRLDVLDQCVFGYLEHERVRINAGVGYRLLHRIHYAGIRELLRCQVDRHRYRTPADFLPPSRLHAGFVNRPFTYGREQPRFFQELE